MFNGSNESSRRDLQSETGPGASGAENTMNIKEILRGTFWDIVLSQMMYFGGFRSSEWYQSNAIGEIYNLGLVPEPPELNKS